MAAMKFVWALLATLAAALALVACSPITALNVLAPAGTHTRTPDVAYGSGPRQQLDIYRPVQPAPAGGWPVVVFFYGGSWNSGDRGDYRFLGEALAAQGVLTLIADYRLYPQVRSMFEFFAREGKLEEFYRQLCATWKSDPTGAAAIASGER